MSSHNPLEVQIRETEQSRQGPLRAPRGRSSAPASAAASAAAAARDEKEAASATGNTSMFAGLNPNLNPAMKLTDSAPSLAAPAKAKGAWGKPAAAASASSSSASKKEDKKKVKLPNRLIKNTNRLVDDDSEEDEALDESADGAASAVLDEDDDVGGDEDEDDAATVGASPLPTLCSYSLTLSHPTSLLPSLPSTATPFFLPA